MREDIKSWNVSFTILVKDASFSDLYCTSYLIKESVSTTAFNSSDLSSLISLLPEILISLVDFKGFFKNRNTDVPENAAIVITI
jgi:hypothetical protein